MAFCMFLYRVGQKMGPLLWKAHIFCLHLQNATTNFYDFWHTSTPLYSEHICWFKIRQIYQSGVSWQKLITLILLSMSAKGSLIYMFRRKNLDKLLIKIDCSSISGDRKIAAIHDQLEHRTFSKANTACWWFDLQWGIKSRKSRGREASVNGDVVSNVLCSRATDTSNRSSNNTLMFIQSVFMTFMT